MNALVKAELLRLASRRLLVLLLVCMAALAAFGAAVDAGNARPLTGDDHRNAQQSWAMEKQAWQEQCGDTPSNPDCEGWEVSDSAESHLRTPSSFGEYVGNVLSLGSYLMVLAAAVLAASLVGAEFASGNIGTQLLFTPRRVPLLLAKVLAAALGGVLMAAVYLGAAVAFCALMFLALRGAHDMTAGLDLPLALGRLMVLALVIAVLSAALTMAVGSVLVTTVVLAVVLVGSSILSDALSGAGAVLQRFLPSNIFWAMESGRHEVYTWTASHTDLPDTTVITYDWALGYSVVVTALIVILAAWWFRRRDILH